MENKDQKEVEAVKFPVEIVNQLKVRKGKAVETFYEPLFKDVFTIDPSTEAEQIALQTAINFFRKAGVKLVMTSEQAKKISEMHKKGEVLSY